MHLILGMTFSIDIVTTDPQGGIHRIDFVIFDVTGNPIEIMRSSQLGQTSIEVNCFACTLVQDDG